MSVVVCEDVRLRRCGMVVLRSVHIAGARVWSGLAPVNCRRLGDRGRCAVGRWPSWRCAGPPQRSRRYRPLAGLPDMLWRFGVRVERESVCHGLGQPDCHSSKAFVVLTATEWPAADTQLALKQYIESLRTFGGLHGGQHHVPLSEGGDSDHEEDCRQQARRWHCGNREHGLEVFAKDRWRGARVRDGSTDRFGARRVVESGQGGKGKSSTDSWARREGPRGGAAPLPEGRRVQSKRCCESAPPSPSHGYAGDACTIRASRHAECAMRRGCMNECVNE